MAKRNKVSRDSHGRGVKGTSGNPKGRPHKYAKVDHGDLERFMNTVREVNTPDGRIMMTREAAIQYRLYQSAMQGNVHAQIFLARRFEKRAEKSGEVLAKFTNLVARLRAEKREPTWEESVWLRSAQVFMHAVPSEEEMNYWKRRLHRKPKRKDGGSDPSVKS